MSAAMSSDSPMSSPSPSPEPEPSRPLANSDPKGARLGDMSELSELSEDDDQETENRKHHQGGDDDSYDDRPRRSSRRGGVAVSPRSEWKRRKSDPNNDTVVEEEEEEEAPDRHKAQEEEEEEDEEDDSRPTHPRSRPREKVVEDDDEDEDDGAEGDDADTAPLDDAADAEDDISGDDEPIAQSRRSARGPRTLTYLDESLAYLSSTERANVSDYDDDDDDISDRLTAPPDDNVDSENDNETESEDEDPKNELPAAAKLSSPTVPLSTHAKSTKLSPSATLANIDHTVPLPHAVVPLAAVAAASSIMAGSGVIDPPSPSASDSASGSPASSRSPTPAFRASGKAVKRVDVDGHVLPKSHSKRKLSAAEKHAELLPLTVDGLETNAAATELEVPEPDGSVEDLEADEPEPDQDLEMELESDLQPAHRAEALDVLATIELKFALLRERVYVDKMEGLAWEEALVSEGSHPELIHLHAELSKRRDKRLELATRKRAYEMASVGKRRALEEDATWSWWKFTRDELQMEMISETNRKRRRLERERRAIERPQPVRRIPRLPHDTPVPPTLRKIVKASSFAGPSRQRGKRDHRPQSTKTIYPKLHSLTGADISADLNYLYQNRRTSFETQRLGAVHPNNVNAPVGPQPNHGYDQFSSVPGMDGLGIPPPFGGASGSRMPPPPAPPFLNQHQPLPMSGVQPPGFLSLGSSGPGRQHHHAPLNFQNHGTHPQYMLEPEMASIAPGAGPPSHSHFPSHHTYFGSAPAGIGVIGQVGHGFSSQPVTRRSISPVPVVPSGHGGSAPGTMGGKQNGGWIGLPHTGSKPPGPSEWMAEGRRNEMLMGDMEDEGHDGGRVRDSRREKERMRDRSERDRERELQEMDRDHERERAFQLQQQQPQHQHRHPPPSQHQHVHGPPGQVSHHMLGQHHHHHHHHHHVLHHHAPNSVSGGHSSSAPPPNIGSALSPRVVSSREFENAPPHIGQRSTEIINLSSSKSSMSSAWKGNDPHALPPSSEFRESRKHSSRPPSGPPVLDDRERTLAMPFALNSTYGTTGNGPSTFTPPANGLNTLPGVPSPRASWNNGEDSGFRIPPPSTTGYLGSTESHGNSPSHRYATTSSSHLGRGPPPTSRQNSIGLSPPRPRANVPPSPSSSTAYAGSARSPTRFGPPPPHNNSGSHSHGSPSLKARRPPSPVPGKRSIPSGSSSTYSPVGSSTPIALGPPLEMKNAGSAGSFGRAGSPPPMTFGSNINMQGLAPAARAATNSNGVGHGGGDKNSPHLPPVLTPKMSVAQMVDGR